MIAFLILAAQTPAALDAAHTAYASCVATQTVRLGAGNAETADTILRAVAAACEPEWDALQVAFPGGTGVTSWEQTRVQALAGWRRQAEDAGIAALLEARAKSPRVP